MHASTVRLDDGPQIVRSILRRPLLALAVLILIVMTVAAILAPFVAPKSPFELDPFSRLKPPSAQNLLGTDAVGRDLLSRIIWGARTSLGVGLAVMLLSVAIGIALGLVATLNQTVDQAIMRLLDGVMAVPGILLAIALTSVARPGLVTVIVAITIPELPRVARLVRSLTLTLWSQPYVEAAIIAGARTYRLLWRHVVPNIAGPVIVQAAFIFASAIIIEAYLSFLGAGVPPEVPSWGNITADGRSFIRLGFHIILYPGICLALTVFAINIVGDSLRDYLDPQHVDAPFSDAR